MIKVMRLESNGLLHCAFHPLCTVTRNTQIEGVNYPRKAAQQYLLKHEKKCLHNPNLRTVQSCAAAGTLATPPHTTSQSIPSSPKPAAKRYKLSSDQDKSSPVDCTVLCAWNDVNTVSNTEQKLKNTMLLSLALSTRGLTVWPSQQESPNQFYPPIATIHNTKHVVLVFQAGEFKDGQIDVQFLEQLQLAKQLVKCTTVLLFDVPNLLSVIPPSLLNGDLIAWLQSPEVYTYVVQMKYFYVIIEAIVKSIVKHYTVSGFSCSALFTSCFIYMIVYIFLFTVIFTY
jgi:hypothetical protein